MSAVTGGAGGAAPAVRAASRLSRRAALGAGAAAGLAGATGLAACANSGSDDAGAPSAAASGAAVVIALDDVPVGGVRAVTVDRRPAFVARPAHDTVRAFSAICTHRGCTVAADPEILICPCHGSHFDLLTGAVLRGPATEPLPPIAVHLQAGQVLAGPG